MLFCLPRVSACRKQGFGDANIFGGDTIIIFDILHVFTRKIKINTANKTYKHTTT